MPLRPQISALLETVGAAPSVAARAGGFFDLSGGSPSDLPIGLAVAAAATWASVRLCRPAHRAQIRSRWRRLRCAFPARPSSPERMSQGGRSIPGCRFLPVSLLIRRACQRPGAQRVRRAVACVLSGVFFFLASAVALLRFPDS